MSVCGDKVCSSQVKCTTNNCGKHIPHMCGDSHIYIPQSQCGSLRFVGVVDVSIAQGTVFDLTEGVHAYDGNGNEVPYTYTPTELDWNTPGEYTVLYTAEGIGNDMSPTMCLDDPLLHIPICETGITTATRVITITSASAACEAYACQATAQ